MLDRNGDYRGGCGVLGPVVGGALVACSFGFMANVVRMCIICTLPES